jgi:SPP1 family predicted phage head-tail adaptor
MRADMRNKISILSKVNLQNDYGEVTDNWEIIKSNLWASKEPILGNEYFSAKAVQSKVEVKFRTHFISGITDEMRIQEGSEVYEILSAINVKSLNRELLMYCKKVT